MWLFKYIPPLVTTGGKRKGDLCQRINVAESIYSNSVLKYSSEVLVFYLSISVLSYVKVQRVGFSGN